MTSYTAARQSAEHAWRLLDQYPVVDSNCVHVTGGAPQCLQTTRRPDDQTTRRPDDQTSTTEMGRATGGAPLSSTRLVFQDLLLLDFVFQDCLLGFALQDLRLLDLVFQDLLPLDFVFQDCLLGFALQDLRLLDLVFQDLLLLDFVFQDLLLLDFVLQDLRLLDLVFQDLLVSAPRRSTDAQPIL